MAALIGVGVAYVTAATTGVILSVGVATTIGSILLLGASLALANALKPNLGDLSIDGQGQILNTTKNNTSAVPVVYGLNRLAGNVIWETTNNYSGGSTNNDYWAIIALTDGDIYNYMGLYADNKPMENTSTTIGYEKYALPNRYVNAHYSSGDGLSLADVLFPVSGTLTVPGSVIFSTPSVSVSSTSLGGSGNLTDGLLSTFWQPSTSADEWILLVNNVSTTVDNASINIRDRLYSGTGYEYSFKMQYSDDNSSWNDASVSFTNRDGYGTSWVDINITETSAHLYWRIYFDDIAQGAIDVAEVFEVDFTSDTVSMVSIPGNISFMAVHHVYDSANYPLIQNITAEIRGRELEIFSGSSTTLTTDYTNSPPCVVYDIMKEALGVTVDDIDTQSFFDAQIHCISNDLDCNIVYPERQNTDSALQAALATMRGHLVFSDNKWKIIFDAPRLTAKSLTDDDIVENTLSISVRQNSEVANKITVKYINPDDEWQVAEASFTDPALVVLDGEELEQIIEVRGCTDTSQAIKIAELTLNKMRHSNDSEGNKSLLPPLDISFVTTVKNSDIEVGDVIQLTHDLLPFPRRFRVASIDTDQSGAISIGASEYCDTHYEDPYGTPIIS